MPPRKKPAQSKKEVQSKPAVDKSTCSVSATLALQQDEINSEVHEIVSQIILAGADTQAVT